MNRQWNYWCGRGWTWPAVLRRSVHVQLDPFGFWAVYQHTQSYFLDCLAECLEIPVKFCKSRFSAPTRFAVERKWTHVFHNTNGRWLFINLSGRICFLKFCEAIGFSSPFPLSFSVLILLQYVVLCLWVELFWWVSRDSLLCLSFKYVKTYVASVHAFVMSQSDS